MRILDRYIGQTVLISILSVLVVILALFLLINFVNEIEKIGRQDYTVWKATLYVLFKMPQNTVTNMPCLVSRAIR